jgi:hypothetical protein
MANQLPFNLMMGGLTCSILIAKQAQTVATWQALRRSLKFRVNGLTHSTHNELPYFSERTSWLMERYSGR